MKKLILILLVAFSLTLKATLPEYKWIKEIPFHVTQIISDNYDNVIIAGEFNRNIIYNNTNLYSTSDSVNFIISKIDSSGNILWHKTFQTYRGNSINNLKINSLNEIIMICSFHDYLKHQNDTLHGTVGVHNIGLVKLTENGQISYFGKPAYNPVQCIHAFDISVDKWNNILINGNIQKGIGYFDSIEINTNNKTISFHALYNNNIELQWVDTTISHSNSIHFNSDSTFYVLSDSIIKMNYNRDIIWKIKPEYPARKNYDGSSSFDVDKLGNIYIIAGTNRKAHLVKYSSAGNQVFSKTFNCSAGSKVNKIYVEDKNIYITGNVRDFIDFQTDSIFNIPNKSTSFFSNFDTSGVFLEASLILLKGNNNFPNFNITKTQSIYFSLYSSNSDSVFFDTLGIVANNGCLLARMYNEPQSAKIIKNKELHIYPNPSEDYITIESEHEFDKATIEIINSAGITVRKYEVSSSTSKIQIKDLKQGIYYIKLTTPKVTRTSRFIKI